MKLIINFFLTLLVLALLVSCKQEYTAQKIVDESIGRSRLYELENSALFFSFKNSEYIANRINGNFELLKINQTDSAEIKDILSNNGFNRFINGVKIELSPEQQSKYSNSVNSVHYFSVLPLGLNDAAVNKKLLNPVVIKSKPYYKIEVTFKQERGGEDFEDIFIYWFNKKSFLLEYLAYKYHTNGGGLRFRAIKKEHLIKGVRLVDYTNYKPNDKQADLYTLDQLYEKGELSELSEIKLSNISLKKLVK
ncbi:MAG: DUF6503 family protein [Tenacibaculum sp.]